MLVKTAAGNSRTNLEKTFDSTNSNQTVSPALAMLHNYTTEWYSDQAEQEDTGTDGR